MAEEMCAVVPGHPHLLVAWGRIDKARFPVMEEVIELDPARPAWSSFELLRRLWPRWVGLMAVLWTSEQPLWQRLVPFLVAPHKFVAVHTDGERHHLSFSRPVASWRFARGEQVGDIFRPSVLTWVGEVLAWLPVPLLLAGWLIARMRKVRRAEPAPVGAEGFTMMCLPGDDFLERLDEEVRAAHASEILATSEPTLPDRATAEELREALRRSGAWLVFSRASSLYHLAGSPAQPARRENGTFCLGAGTSVFLFRRDVFLRLGGLLPIERQQRGLGLAAICLRGFGHGEKAAYAAHVAFPQGSERPASNASPPALATLILSGVDHFPTAARLLHKHGRTAAFWRDYWKAVPKLTPPTAGGKRTPKLVALAEPGCCVLEGRPPGKRLNVGVVTPYLPYPLSHGGAIRMHNLLRRCAADCDISLFVHSEDETAEHLDVMLEWCTRIVLVRPPTWETPRPFRVLPSGVWRYRRDAMQAHLRELVSGHRLAVVQAEFTQLAFTGSWLQGLPAKTILVEHDVTFDLYRQSASASPSRRQRFVARLEAARWKRYELAGMRRFDRVVTMSLQDRQRLIDHHVPASKVQVIENGIDLTRFRATAADPGNQRLLFIGSFRHFPNLRGYRFFLERIWPLIIREKPETRLTVVSGPDPAHYWRQHTGEDMPPAPHGVDLHAFVEDVRPLYESASIVVVPLPISAGTNIKVLEALAMGRPIVSTQPGCAGLGLDPGQSVLVADDAAGFAHAVLRLLENPELRRRLAAAGRRCVEERYDWDTLAQKQLALFEELARASKE